MSYKSTSQVIRGGPAPAPEPTVTDEPEEKKPTVRRVRMGDKFERDPVDLDTFLYDDEYLAQPKLSAVQFEAVRYLETIYLPEDEKKLCTVLGWDPVRLIHFAALEWGKGSGKDHICCIVLARWVDRLLCLKNPQEYYGKAPQSFIHFLNIASSAGQASRAFFAAFRALVKNAKCFQGQYTVVSGDRSRDRIGGEPGKYEIEFAKQITAVSGHSGSASQEGLNLLGAIADEISEFRTKAEVERTARQSSREPSNTADAVIRLMKTSGRTRFPYSFKNAFLSYPRFAGDAIEQLIAKAQLDNQERGTQSKWYFSGPKPTWEVNPTVSDRAAFEDDYRDDPATAEAMYECRPGRATNRAFRNDVAIMASFARKIDPPLKVTYYWGTDQDGPKEALAPEEMPGWQVHYDFDEVWPWRGCAYALHADMAVNGDRAGMAMAHISEWKLADWEGVHGVVREQRPIVKVDFMATLESDTGLQPVAREVQIRWFRKLVWLLSARGFHIGWVSMDGFQSTDSLQIMTSRGIEAEVLSCDRANSPVWKTLQDLMYDGRLNAYYDDLTIFEIQSLRKRAGGKVDHPDGGSKDLADAVAAAVYGALEAGGAGEGTMPERADEGNVDYFTQADGGAASLLPEGFTLDIERVDLTPTEW
jgi:hypothetical protein